MSDLLPFSQVIEAQGLNVSVSPYQFGQSLKTHRVPRYPDKRRKVASEGYHRIRLAVEDWSEWEAAAKARKMSVRGLMELVAWNLDRVLPLLKLEHPPKK